MSQDLINTTVKATWLYVALKEGPGKVGTARTATCSLRLAPYLAHWSAIQPLLYGYNTAGPAGKSSSETTRAYLCPLFLRRQLDSPSLHPPPRSYLTIYSFELDLLDPLRLPNLSLISMDQAISRPLWHVNCDPRVSGKMRMSHESKYCFSAPYMPPEFTISQRIGTTDTRNDNCSVDSRVIMDGLCGPRDYITDPLCECQRLRAQ